MSHVSSGLRLCIIGGYALLGHALWEYRLYIYENWHSHIAATRLASNIQIFNTWKSFLQWKCNLSICISPYMHFLYQFTVLVLKISHPFIYYILFHLSHLLTTTQTTFWFPIMYILGRCILNFLSSYRSWDSYI